MNGLTLSYILTTFNKLDYLKLTLPLLIQARREDEEIIVVDGGSGDGTKDYLTQLFREKQIDQFISEPDRGEAQGSNKAMLLAKGTLIKIITDDDLFDFNAIQDCKKFLLQHPSIDVLGFDGYSCKLADKPRFEKTNFIHGYKKWQQDGSAFLFCGLSLMIRRSALSYLGLFNTSYRIIDMEYALRISSLRSNIAFYTGPAFINLVNPESNSVKFYDTIREEYKRLRRAYPEAHINFRLNNPILMLKERINRLRKKHLTTIRPDKSVIMRQYSISIERGLELLNKNLQQPYEFLTRLHDSAA